MSGIRSLVRRARRTSLGVKLVVLGMVVMAAVVLVSFWGLERDVRASTRDALSSELARNQVTLQQLRQRQVGQLLMQASLITQVPTFTYTLNMYRVQQNSARADRAAAVRTLEEELDHRLANVGGDVLAVTDDSGHVFASAGRRGAALAHGMDVSSLDAVRAVLDPTARPDTGSLGVLETGMGDMQVVAYPLVQTGFTVGALILGQRIDTTFLAAAQSGSEGGALVMSGSRIVTSTNPSLATPTMASLLAARGTASDSTTLVFDGKEFVVAPVLLGETQSHAPVRLWMVQPLTVRIATLMHPLRRRFLIYGVLALLLTALGASLVARTVLGPFQRFVRYMRSGAATGTGERQQTFAADDEALEVRTLNESFNQLMDSLSSKRRDLETRTAELTAANVVLTDEISERTRVETALRESEAQLRQSQKLEAIGTLAGGIAHDFNNLITVISGYTQLALMRTEKSNPAAEDLKQVVEASDRAANLTHQLLAFSRKQVLQPTVLDLAEVVSGIAPMLRRIISEHIELQIESDPSLARVRADRGQLEQVLLNLAVNARDAMPAGGRLLIATRNLFDALDGASTGDHSAAHAVSLTVSDTGTGMSPEIRDRIFEPFFTTKEVGKGTGLGLSTVYGIVNQSGGTIAVDSRLGAGTSFTITLPASEQMAAMEGEGLDDFELPNGTETVLVVEDAEDVRILARRSLEERGYTVFVARSAAEALEISAVGPIDLLLTDIVMPRTSGPQLVAQYLATRPAPIVMYMSGYADDALTQYELNADTHFLRKPFTPAKLARAVRAAIDSGLRPRVESAAD